MTEVYQEPQSPSSTTGCLSSHSYSVSLRRVSSLPRVLIHSQPFLLMVQLTLASSSRISWLVVGYRSEEGQGVRGGGGLLVVSGASEGSEGRIKDRDSMLQESCALS